MESTRNNKQLERIFGKSLFQTRLLANYHTALKNNPNKTIKELYYETSDNSKDIEESQMSVFTEASLIEHFYTSFVLCFVMYENIIKDLYMDKVLNEIGIQISVKINIKENSAPELKSVRDCSIYHFGRHLRNSLSHARFEIKGDGFTFIDKHGNIETFNAKFNITEMQEILEKWQLFIVRSLVKTI